MFKLELLIFLPTVSFDFHGKENYIYMCSLALIVHFYLFHFFVMLWSVFPIHTCIWKHLMRAVLACALVNKISPFLACIVIAVADIIFLTNNFSYVPLPLYPPSSFFFFTYLSKSYPSYLQDLSEIIVSLHTICHSPTKNTDSHPYQSAVIMSASKI